MIKIILTFILLVYCQLKATFSIVAIDTLTGQIGSAGASCISNSIIISDMLPGIGVIHTQSYWNEINQDSAGNLMEQGYSPQEIIDWLVNNDAERNDTLKVISKWLPTVVKEDQTELFVYFSGHGLASEDGKDLYLLPTDGDPDLLELTALMRNQLFDQISSLKQVLGSR